MLSLFSCSKSSKPELILGIRNLAGLKACSRYADAVYFSTDRLSLRAKAKEITLETLNDFVYEVKSRGLRAYLAVNSTVNEDRLGDISDVVTAAVKAGVDAVIAWDPAVILRARKAGLEVHISTQANVTNHETAEFYRTLGAERIVLSRELSLEEIQEDQSADRSRDRNICSRRNVHGYFRQVPSVGLCPWKIRKLRGVHPALPLGMGTSWREWACCRKPGEILAKCKRPLYDRAYSRTH